MNHPTSNRRCLSYRRVIRHSRKNLQIEAVCMGAYGAGIWRLGFWVVVSNAALC